jgi:hypothetical protein
MFSSTKNRIKKYATKYIATDINNCWDYTFRMIKNTEDHKTTLNNLIDEYPKLENLRLTKDY